MADVHVDIEVEGRGEHGRQHDEHDPGDLGRRIPRPVDHHQGHEEAHRQRGAVDHVLPQAEEPPEEQNDLDRQQQEDHRRPPEDQIQELFLPLVQDEHPFFTDAEPFFFCHTRFLSHT